MGLYLHEQLRMKLQPSRHVGFVAGKGLLAGIEFVEDKVTKKPFERSRHVAEDFVNFAFSKGLVLWPNSGQVDGTNGDIVMIAPPLTIEKSQIDELSDLMKSSVKEFFKA